MQKNITVEDNKKKNQYSQLIYKHIYKFTCIICDEICDEIKMIQ